MSRIQQGNIKNDNSCQLFFRDYPPLFQYFAVVSAKPVYAFDNESVVGLGVTVDYMLADSVSDSDINILEQFRQITDRQPLERKQLAIKVLRAIFSHFENAE